jgi:hypothetical protein
MIITGMLATAIGWNRRMIEDVLFRMKSDNAEVARVRPGLRRLVAAGQDADTEDAEVYATRSQAA